jgi:hypothetical protein
MVEHRALLYTSAEEFPDAVVPFVDEGMRAGDSGDWYAAPGRTLRAYKD